MSDIVRVEQSNINCKGYGTIPKLVMQDKRLHIISKAIYAYFKSFAGSGESCFPSREKMCDDLNISKDTLSKYIKPLCDYRYISIEQAREKGKFSHNIYTIHDSILDNEDIVYENIGYGTLDTNNNNILNNNNNKNYSISSSSNIYNYIEENFGRTLYPIEYELIGLWEDNDLTRHAIKQAVLNGVNSVKYIDRILQSYKAKDITTVEQAVREEERFNNQKNNKGKYVDKSIGSDWWEEQWNQLIQKDS